MKTSNSELVNDCFTCEKLANNTLVISKSNNCLLDLDKSQHESLLQPHQARAFGVIVEDVANRHSTRDGRSGG